MIYNLLERLQIADIEIKTAILQSCLMEPFTQKEHSQSIDVLPTAACYENLFEAYLRFTRMHI